MKTNYHLNLMNSVAMLDGLETLVQTIFEWNGLRFSIAPLLFQLLTMSYIIGLQELCGSNLNLAHLDWNLYFYNIVQET